MRRARYRRIRAMLSSEYFVPETGSKERLEERLGISDRGMQAERRFVMAFRVALAAAAILACLSNIDSVRPEYLNRYAGRAIVASVRAVDTSPLWGKLFAAEAE